MAYTCRLYLNSGFNSINIPDSPALLNTVNYIDVPSLQILQSRDLRYVDVKVSSYESIKNADYCRVDDWYYFIDGIQMLNMDTARITIIADYLTSAGGPSAVHILDGITVRVHAGSDNYGEWVEEDPYMTPARPMELETVNTNAGSINTIVIKSTLDLDAMGAPGRAHEGIEYTDATSGEGCVVPSTIQNQAGSETAYELQNGSSPNLSLTGEASTKLFKADDSNIKRALKEINDLGTNGAVTAQVVIPFRYVTPLIASGSTATIEKMTGCNIVQALTNLPFEYSNAVKNKRVLYGSDTPYGIIATGGARCEFAPYQIYEPGETAPHLRIIADPRTDGKPYFRFLRLHGDDSILGFFNSAVEGMQWKQVPLVYEGAQGAALAQLTFNQNERKRSFEYDVATNKAINPGTAIKNSIASGFSYLGSWANDTANQWAAGNIFQNLPGVGGSKYNDASAGIWRDFTAWMTDFSHQQTDAYSDGLATRRYLLDRETERQQLMINTRVYSPTVQFPFSADLFRDLFNNSCIVYRYKYSAFDLARIDKILTMYGYRITKNLESTDFTNRTKFNYVEAGVSVGKLPRWQADGIAAQLSAGVRIWHVLPDKTHYTNNPIAT